MYQLTEQASKEKVPETLDPVVLIQQLTKALAVALVRYVYIPCEHPGSVNFL